MEKPIKIQGVAKLPAKFYIYTGCPKKYGDLLLVTQKGENRYL